MKKTTVILSFFMIYFCLAVPAVAPQSKINNSSWSEVKPYYERAIRTGFRTNVGGEEQEYLKQVKNLSEKDEVIRYHLLAFDGSYTDHIIPTLGLYLELYDQAIKKEKSEEKRKNLFSKELKGLLDIFKKLDEQIASYQRSWRLAQEKYRKTLQEELDRAPTEEEIYRRWNAIDREVHGGHIGFFSTQVEAQKGARSYEAYHQLERDLIAGALVTWENSRGHAKQDYEKIFATMTRDIETNRLRAATFYM